MKSGCLVDLVKTVIVLHPMVADFLDKLLVMNHDHWHFNGTRFQAFSGSVGRKASRPMEAIDNIADGVFPTSFY